MGGCVDRWGGDGQMSGWMGWVGAVSGSQLALQGRKMVHFLANECLVVHMSKKAFCQNDSSDV